MTQRLTALFASLLLTGMAFAESDQDNKPRREHRGPPEVALEACANLVRGDACTFEGRRGESLEGSCEAPDDKPLACRPADGPPRGERE